MKVCLPLSSLVKSRTEALLPSYQRSLTTLRWISLLTPLSLGGRWLLTIQIPPSYPLAPPTITFTTPICHPNIHFKTGEICLDLLKTSWSPAYTISSTLTAIQQLLESGEPDSPLNIDVAVLMREGDWVGVEGLIRFYTGMFRYEGELGRREGRRDMVCTGLRK
jgi:hypothetical protein